MEEELLAPTAGRWRRTPASEMLTTVMLSARSVSVLARWCGSYDVLCSRVFIFGMLACAIAMV
jgi:hypothetical protein